LALPERTYGRATCGTATSLGVSPSGTTANPKGAIPPDHRTSELTGTTSNIQMSDSYGGAIGGGVALITLAFTGALNGDTLAGSYSLGSSFIGNPGANGSVFNQVAPLTGVAVTLAKR